MRKVIRYLAKDAATLIKNLGGPDVVDDVDEVAWDPSNTDIQVIDQTILHWQWAIEHGLFTPEGLEAKTVFEQGHMISMKDGKPVKQGIPSCSSPSHPSTEKPWICGCFTSKSAAAMLKFFKEEAAAGKKSVNLFWQTKSLYQAVGDVDPLSRLKEQTNNDPVVQQWLKDSEITDEATYVPFTHKI